jgi:putative phosphoesterase
MYRKVGFLADTHSAKPDGSDLPDAVLKAFKGVDLIVHLGDVGRKGILARLGEVAPVWVPYGDGKGFVPDDAREGDPVKVIDGAKGTRVGLQFNLVQPDKKIAIDGASPSWDDGALPALLKRRFKEEVGVVAFGGTHMAFAEERDGVLFVNPGSPTLPSDGQGSVALLDLSTAKPKAKIIRL